MSDLRGSERDEVGADDEACVDNCQVVECRILQDKRSYDGEVDVGCRELTGGWRSELKRMTEAVKEDLLPCQSRICENHTLSLVESRAKESTRLYFPIDIAA